jgi:hypothetical protein
MTSLLVLANPDRHAADVLGELTAWAARSLADPANHRRRPGFVGDGSREALVARIGAPGLAVETAGSRDGRRSSPTPPGPRQTQSRELVGRVAAGHVRLDVGRFADLAAVASFCDLLRRIPGPRDVAVTGFTTDRAEIELTLAAPVALGRELRATSPIVIADGAESRVTINLHA